MLLRSKGIAKTYSFDFALPMHLATAKTFQRQLNLFQGSCWLCVRLDRTGATTRLWLRHHLQSATRKWSSGRTAHSLKWMQTQRQPQNLVPQHGDYSAGVLRSHRPKYLRVSDRRPITCPSFNDPLFILSNPFQRYERRHLRSAVTGRHIELALFSVELKATALWRPMWWLICHRESDQPVWHCFINRC